MVEAKNIEDLTKRIIQMIESTPEKILKMSEVSYKIAKERFDIRIINKKMLEIMELE